MQKAFKYNIPFGRNVFRYNSFCKHLSGLLTDYTCFCKENNMTQLLDNSRGHIITGNLNIINNLQLQNIMSLETKFRITSFNNQSNILKIVMIDIEKYVNTFSYNYSFFLEGLLEWKYHFKMVVSELLQELYLNTIFFKIKSDIKMLQNRYIMTYVDKTINTY